MKKNLQGLFIRSKSNEGRMLYSIPHALCAKKLGVVPLKCFIVLCILAGCAPMPEKKAPASIEKEGEMHPYIMSQISGSSTEISKDEGLEDLIITEIEEERKPEKLFSFTFRDEDIKSIMLALGRVMPFNIIVEPDVAGTVTMDLKDVTLMEAMEALTAPLGLDYKFNDKTIRVFRPKPEGRLFALNYMTTTRAGKGGMSATAGGSGALASSASSIATADASDLWADIETGLGSLISENGKVTINKMANTIHVTDLPKILLRIAEFLEQIEGTVHRQVLIQAKIVEVSLTDEFRMGLDWDAITKAGTAEGTLGTGKMFSQALGAGATAFQIGVTDAGFSILLDAMKEQGTLNVLSNPQIATLNNQKAIMRAGTELVVFTPLITIDPDTRERTESVTSETITEGVVLDVTPQIGSDGLITMSIHPSITEKVGEASYKSALTEIVQPIMSIRETDTVVRVKSGQTLIIAGQMREKVLNRETRVPILGAIPLLGALFRSTNEQTNKSELVIMLTPTIIIGEEIAGK